MLLWDVIFKYCLNCFCLYVHSQVNNQSIEQYDETSCIVFSWSNISAVIVGQDSRPLFGHDMPKSAICATYVYWCIMHVMTETQRSFVLNIVHLN